MMLAILSLATVWLTSTANIALSQQVADSNYTPSVAHPAYEEDSPRVLFDEAHSNIHTAEGRYKPFVDLITQDGYEMVPNQQLFQPETLADYDLLVIANALSAEEGAVAFEERECDAVRDWVESGGALLLIADHKPFGAAAANLADRFGVTMSNSFTADPFHADEETDNPNFLLFSRQNKLLAEHPITEGRNSAERIDRVLAFTGQSLSVPPGGEPLLLLSDTAVNLDRRLNYPEDLQAGEGSSAANQVQGIALRVGQGRVIVLGEAAMLSAQQVQMPDGESLLIGMNRLGVDNQQFALNIMHWLSGLLD
ncbi:DUF4350 domain-containing protein [Pseudanabaena sp. FACHB-2040]|uniref:DUF4350 domain-containing protein n=1 Tax=Pseudanabaena sp. FACHB-2040 TaxID=2692859 RepID=UPI0016887BB3|nr:DUF4350 domain-containing protein [Pseudanabaena sp. FACHB-2040]MBD2256203.1 DUF4350 domain-containing protein [Pseudanabaena sp. FACHB-2040]